MTLRIGVIGCSDGNGHPYSWSAIFNGYDVDAMQDCEYPVIPEYLGEQTWPDAAISGAVVSSIWTQDHELSARIAKASHIEHISKTLSELANTVDAILLARDDAENHIHLAKPFLELGKPIYIDKPIALSVAALVELYALQQYPGQIFTCSALSYGNEFRLTKNDRAELGTILSIAASTPKSWKKYAVHIIEPVLKIIGTNNRVTASTLRKETETVRSLDVFLSDGVFLNFKNLGSIASPIQIHIKGSKSSKNLVFKDSFAAFKTALQDFVGGISDGKSRTSLEFNTRVVELIEKGNI